MALGEPPKPRARSGGRPGPGRHRSDLDQWPPSIGSPPSPAWNRPSAPLPTKLKAWVTIGYRPSSSNRISTMAPWAGERSTAWRPSCPRCPRLQVDALLDDLVEDRPDHVEARVDARAGVEDEDAHRLAHRDLDRVVGVLVGDAVEDHEVRGRGAGRCLARGRSSAPCSPRYHSLWTNANSWSTGGRPSSGSTMIIPNMPFAMCISAGRGAAVVHEHARVLGLELVDELLTRIDRAHLVVPGDHARVEVDRVRHRVRLGVLERDADHVADLDPQDRARAPGRRTSRPAARSPRQPSSGRSVMTSSISCTSPAASSGPPGRAARTAGASGLASTGAAAGAWLVHAWSDAAGRRRRHRPSARAAGQELTRRARG